MAASRLIAIESRGWPSPAVAAGGNDCLALTTDGSVWAWGGNVWAWGGSGYGQLGDGSTTAHDKPQKVGGLDGVTAVAAGGGFSLALRQDGTAWSWGGNGHGELGDGTSTNRGKPVEALAGLIDCFGWVAWNAGRPCAASAGTPTGPCRDDGRMGAGPARWGRCRSRAGGGRTVPCRGGGERAGTRAP